MVEVMYALKVQDGQEPSYRLIRESEEAEPGEVVMEAEPEAGHVWDAASGALRPPSEEETLEPQKEQKVVEMHAAAMDELSPLFTDEHGKDELIFLLAAHVRRILGAQADPRLAKVEEVGSKALAKRDEIQNVQSLEELGAVEWEEQA